MAFPTAPANGNTHTVGGQVWTYNSTLDIWQVTGNLSTVENLGDLANAIETTPATDDFLVYDGTSWVNDAPDNAAGSAFSRAFDAATTAGTISSGGGGGGAPGYDTQSAIGSGGGSFNMGDQQAPWVALISASTGSSGSGSCNFSSNKQMVISSPTQAASTITTSGRFNLSDDSAIALIVWGTGSFSASTSGSIGTGYTIYAI